MRERLDQWLADFAAPRRPTSSACASSSSAASTRRDARGARARARRAARRACSRPAGRSRSAPSMPGSRSCCASRRSRCSTGSALQADTELVEDWREHRAAVHARLPRRLLRDEALRADHARGHGDARPAPAARVARRRVWDRRVEFELADEARRARDQRRAGRGHLARARGATSIPPRRSRPPRGPICCEPPCASSPRRAASWRGMRPKSSPRRSSSTPRGALRRRLVERSSRQTSTPRKFAQRPAAASSGAGRRSSIWPIRSHQHECARRASAHGSPRPRAARRARRLQARARPRRHGRPRARRARPAARRRAVGLGPGAARRARRATC